MPVSSCCLRFDDEAVRIGVCFWLGSTLCVPHQCHCRASVDAFGFQGFVCKKASGRSARHHALNDLVARAMASAGIPVSKQPQILSRSDGKRPDGLSHLMAGREATHFGRCRCVPSADSYVSTTSEKQTQ